MTNTSTENDQKQYNTIKSTDPTSEVIEYHLAPMLNGMRKTRLMQMIHRRADKHDVYAEMLEEGMIQEKGEGTRLSPKTVSLVEIDKRAAALAERRANRSVPFVQSIQRAEWLAFGQSALEKNDDPVEILRSLLQGYIKGELSI